MVGFGAALCASPAEMHRVRVGAAHQKVDQVVSDPIELRMVMDGEPGAVGEQDRLVDGVRDHEHRLIAAARIPAARP
jgi:hypothetical protein